MSSVDIARRYRKQLQENILKLFNNFIRNTKIEDLEKLDVNEVLDRLYLRLETLNKEIENSDYYQLQQVVLQHSGDNIVNLIPKGSLANKYKFDILDENAVNSFRRYRVKSLNDFVYGTVKAVENALERAIRKGKNKKQLITTFKNTLGLTPKQEVAYNNYVSALEKNSLMAFYYQNRDKSKDKIINEAIANGVVLNERQIQQLGDLYLERSKEQRLGEFAFGTALTIASIGEYESFVQAIADDSLDENRLKKYWITSGDERVRANHVVIPQMNRDGVGFLDIFQTPLGPMRYPRDPLGLIENTANCRCYLRYSYD